MNAGIEDVHRLAPLQDGLLLHSLRDDDPTLFVSQLACRLSRGLDPAALERAYTAVIHAHPVLRSSFHAGELAHPVQVVHATVPVSVGSHDLRSAADPEAALTMLLRSGRQRGFDLGRAPLMRLDRVVLADNRDVLVWTFHHLLMDGWSAHLVLDDLLTAYDAERSGREARVATRRPYRDYVAWLDRQDPRQARECFRRRLGDLTVATVLRRDTNGVDPDVERYPDRRLAVPGESAERWQRTGRRARVTLNTLVQAAWGITLSRFTGEPDVVFGTTLAVRPPELSGADNMVGLLLNKLPTRLRIDPSRTLRDWLLDVHAGQVETQQYGYLPLSAAVAESGVPSGTPLFETAVVVENYPIDQAAWHRDSVTVERIEYFQHNNYPLTLLVTEADGTDLILSHDRRRYSDEFARQILDHVLLVLDAMDGCLDRPLGDLPVIPAADRETMFGRRNAAAPDVVGREPSPAVADLAAVDPDRTAVRCADEQLSYGELDRRANRIAHWLVTNGLAPGEPVAVCLPRGVHAVTAFLGVLRAGCVVAAADPEQPDEAWHASIAETGTAGVITTSDLLPGLDFAGCGPLLLLDRATTVPADQPDGPPDGTVRPDDAAWIWAVPSAGQARRPAVGSHHTVHRAGLDVVATCDLSASDVALVLSPMSSAAFAGYLFGVLAVGGSVALPPPGATGPAAARGQEFSCLLGMTPHQLRSWAARGAPPAGPAVRVVTVDGPGLDDRDAALADEIFPAADRVLDRYGPAGSLRMMLRRGSIVSAPEGDRLFVLDSGANPVPAGAVGEIWVGGIGPAQGFAGTAAGAAVVPDRYAAEPGARLCRTGDLGRWRPDGTVTLLGRAEDWIAVGGTRIDTAEVGRVLRVHPGVADAIVTPHVVDGRAGMAAYLLAGRPGPDGAEPVDDDLRRRVATVVPAPGVPITFVRIDEVPVTVAGDVDTSALAALAAGARNDGADLPRTPRERAVADIFRDILGVPRVGRHDSFFELGGTSLGALRMVARVGRVLGVELPLELLFETPTIAGLSRAAERTDGTDSERRQEQVT